MTGSWKSSTFTTEFGHEFEAERGRWLRRRFLWYSGVIGGVNGAGLLFAIIVLLVSGLGPAADKRLEVGVGLISGIITTSLYIVAFVRVYRNPVGRDEVLRIAYWIIVIYGLFVLLGSVVSTELRIASVSPTERRAVSVAGIIGATAAAQILLAHFFACLFLPWTPRESIRPLVPLIVLNAAVTLLYIRGGWVLGLLTIALSPLIGLPGALICWWRHSRFRERFALHMIRGRYTEMRRELVDARRIHESLFPAPRTTGAARFHYLYEPMRQIGGDYLYACSPPVPGGAEPALNIVVIDVTGHGIPAALTVNRLHGELERLFAEEPQIRPGQVLTLVNRYVHLTLATHSVYVTALCLRIDPNARTLEYASGGHPPAFVRAVDGTIEQLDSTSFVLGACAGGDFRAEPRTVQFGPGDTFIAYTDGALEARDERGRMFGVAGLQKLIAASQPDLDGGWPAAILRAVEQHRFGPPADDTLVIEVLCPLVSTAAVHAARAPSSAPAAARP